MTTERRSRSVAGTLVGGDKPRIVEINGIAMEAELVPHMLYVRSDDRPGFVGRLGTLLGEEGINIATFSLGRTVAGGDAISLVGVDEPVADAVLCRVREFPLVVEAKSLSF